MIADAAKRKVFGWVYGALVLLVAIGSAVAGYEYATALGEAEIKRIEGERSKERELAATHYAQALDTSRKALLAETQRGNALAAALLTQQAEFERDRATLHRRIQHVSTQYQRASGMGPEPLPRCIFTRGWLRDYNAAIGAGLDMPGAPADTAGGGVGTQAGAAPAADAGVLLDADITPADILAHVTDYGARCRGLEAQVIALIDRNEGAQP